VLNDQVRINDIAVIVLGHNAGEAVDRSASDFQLTQKEIGLITKVTQTFRAAGKKTIVVLNVTGPVETASWKELPDAILCAYQPGEQAGNSIADVLTGKINPSGKLTVTFPVRLEDNPSTSNFPLAGGSGISGMMMYVQGAQGVRGEKETLRENIDYTNYNEDIYVGYRYFDSFLEPVSYPFGFGLSYTEFSYRDAKVIHDDTGFRITVTVTNLGKVKGREVVQLYVEAPKGDVEKPVHELKAFAKTMDLEPGESETLDMKVTYYDLASFNDKKSAWITDKGIHKFKIGASSRDIRITVDAKLKEKQLEKVNNVLNPESKLNLMRQPAN
jgi:beta-glucosidase